LPEGREIAVHNNINIIERIEKNTEYSFEKPLYSHVSNDPLCNYTHESSHAVVCLRDNIKHTDSIPPLFDIISARDGKELVYFQDHPRGRA